MSSYIDADYIKRYPIRIDHYDEKHGNRYFVLGIESVMDYIEEAPSIDIVRCKECMYADKYYHCNYMTTWNNADDFCSYGERREP